MKKIGLLFFLLFSSCDVIEIPNIPLLAPPLALEVLKTKTLAGERQVAFRFQAFNNETYFSGFRIYITQRKEDLEKIDPLNPMFGLQPTNAAGEPLTNLTNYRVSDTNISISYYGAMATPSIVIYPDADTKIDNTNTLIYSPHKTDGEGNNFVDNVNYYVGVYAYSRVDQKYSLPSITNFSFP